MEGERGKDRERGGGGGGGRKNNITFKPNSRAFSSLETMASR